MEHQLVFPVKVEARRRLIDSQARRKNRRNNGWQPTKRSCRWNGQLNVWIYMCFSIGICIRIYIYNGISYVLSSGIFSKMTLTFLFDEKWFKLAGSFSECRGTRKGERSIVSHWHLLHPLVTPIGFWSKLSYLKASNTRLAMMISVSILLLVGSYLGDKGCCTSCNRHHGNWLEVSDIHLSLHRLSGRTLAQILEIVGLVVGPCKNNEEMFAIE